GSGADRLRAGSVSARAVPLSRGTATAVTAEADRNARRGAPARPRTSLFSISQIINGIGQVSTRSATFYNRRLGAAGAGGKPGPFGIIDGGRPSPTLRAVSVRVTSVPDGRGLLTIFTSDPTYVVTPVLRSGSLTS